MAKIVLAEDHALVREGLKLLLSMEPGLEVVAECGDGAQIYSMIGALQPDLLLLDLDLPGVSGMEVASRVKARYESVKILVLTGSLQAQSVRRALAAGADGYVLKREESSELLIALRAVLAGRQYVSKSIAAMFDEETPDRIASNAEPVTPREQEIMCMIARGLGNQDIADALHISLFTVRKHRQNLMDKLGLHNAAEITAYAIKSGFYEPT